MRPVGLAGLAFAVLAFAVPAPPAHALPPGPLTMGQLHGRNGCLSVTGSRGLCMRAGALDPGRLNGAGSVTTSSDGRHLYVASEGGAVLTLRRDPVTGAVRQSSCVAAPGHGAGCSTGDGLEGATAAAVSPDGRNVYVVSARGEAVAVFSRDAGTGALSQRPCPATDGGPGGCAPGRALAGATGVTVTPDGRHVYVAARLSGAVTVFSRNPNTGALTEAGCVSSGVRGCTPGGVLSGAASVSLGRSGALLYVASDEAVAVLSRDASTGAIRHRSCVSIDGSGGRCAVWPELDGAASAEPSPDGRHLYVAARISNAVTAFRVREGGARLTVAGCVSEDGSRGRCSRGHALDGAAAVSVAPGGRAVYVASRAFSHGLSVFRRNPRSGRVRQLGCISDSRSGRACARGLGMSGSSTAALSPDGRNVYVLGHSSSALAVFGPDIGIAGRSWSLSASGAVKLLLACPGNARGRCRGRMNLTTVNLVPVPGGGRRRLTIASARFSVARGRRRTLLVRVTGRFLPLVRRSERLRIRPTVTPLG